MTESDINRVYERLDNLFGELAEVRSEVQAVNQRCDPCAKLVASHEMSIHGNGKNGLLIDVAKVKSGRVDTLSVKSVVALVSAFGAALAMVIGAIATFTSHGG